MRCRAYLLVIIFVGVAGVEDGLSQAVEPGEVREMTVDDIVSRALAENPELRAARADVEAAQGRLLQAGLRPNPMLDVATQQNVTGPDNNLTVGVTLPLDLNRRREGRVGVAEWELEMKRAQVAERARGLRAEVRLKAGELLAARRNLRITEELFELNRQALDLVRERVRRGAVPSLEESLQRVEVNRLAASRQVVESRVEVLGVQLKALAGLVPEAPLMVRGELDPGLVPLGRQAGPEWALTTRPDILAARADMEMARAKLRKEEAEGGWDASVNVGYMRQGFGFDLNGLTERGEPRPISDVFHYVGGGVTITLPVRNRNQGNIAAALAEGRAAAQRFDAAMLMTRQEVAAAFIQHEAAKWALETYPQGVREVTRQNLAVVRRAYELGRHPLSDVIRRAAALHRD